MANEFVDGDGKFIDFKTWYALQIDEKRVLAFDTVAVNGSPVSIHTRYCGLGGRRYKVGIDGDSKIASHEKYVQLLEGADDAATALKEHARAKAVIEASGTSEQLQAIPFEDQAKARVLKKPVAAQAVQVEP